VRRALAFVILLMACDAPNKPCESQLNVFCLLRTDDSHPVALVGRSVPLGEWPPGQAGWNGVADAAVLVAQDKDTTRFQPVPDSIGYYSCDSLRAKAGSSYRLLVRAPDGDEAKGSTTVPGSFTFESISVDTTIVLQPHEPQNRYAGVQIVWSASQGASGYELLTCCNYTRLSGDTLYKQVSWWCDSCNTGFHARLRVPQGYDTLTLRSIRLVVGAPDHNYQDYLIMQGEYGYRNTLMHLQGGLGVFGSVCLAETTVLLYAPGRNGLVSRSRQ
jgi:hypothetical protein